MASALQRLAYGAAQGLRVSWYYGQKLVAASRAAPPLVRIAEESRAALPGRARRLRDLGLVFERDWRNIAAVLYRLPAALIPHPLAEWRRSRRFFADLESVEARPRANDNSEILRQVPPGRDPRYYLPNFHFHTHRSLSRPSAKLY